jgi:DNA-binding transcriptional ArsR family regulator
MHGDFSHTAALLSDPARAAMLMALMGGAALPAGQLAILGNVAPQTASSHLSKLLQGKLLMVEDQGRHRYYRLASAEVAHAIEALLALGPCWKSDHAVIVPREPANGLAYARSCYSHLAGKLGVEIADALLARQLLIKREPRQFAVTPQGREWFAKLGIELTKAQEDQPRFARCCLDWTERRYHLAGKLGSMMLSRFRELKWIAPVRDSRALRVTLTGEREFYKLLRINGNRGRGWPSDSR